MQRRFWLGGFGAAALWFGMAAMATDLVVDTTRTTVLSPSTPGNTGARCTAAAGDCSLYDAKVESDAIPGTDRIVFDIPMSDSGCNAGTGVCRISAVQDAFFNPALRFTDTVEIDGYTQPGALANTIAAEIGGVNMAVKIEIGGPSTSDVVQRQMALVNGGVVRGIAFTRLHYAIKAEPAWGKELRIEGCIFGAQPTFTTMTPNGRTETVLRAIVVGESNVGGSGPVPRVVVGGTVPAQRNWFADLTYGAVLIRDKAVDLAVQGNVIALDKDGSTRSSLDSTTSLTTDLPPGVTLAAQTSLMIGGAQTGSRNRIGSNVSLTSKIAAGQGRVQGNDLWIAANGSAIVNATGALDVGEGYLVGGTQTDEGNRFGSTVSVAKQNGLNVAGRSLILGNRYRNIAGSYPTDLPISTNGRAGGGYRNDGADADLTSGGLTLQNFPVISGWALNGDQLSIDYTVDSASNHSAYDLTVEFYLNRRLTSGGHYDVEWIGRDVFPVASIGQVRHATIVLPVGLVWPTAPVILATASSATVGSVSGETSEFSFHDAQLSFDPATPAVLALNQANTVRVRIATTAPFYPAGRLELRRTYPLPTAVLCAGDVVPTSTPSVSELVCTVTPTQAGAFDVLAYWRAAGTSFFDLNQPASGPTDLQFTRSFTAQTISIDLFKNGFESDPAAP